MNALKLDAFARNHWLISNITAAERNDDGRGEDMKDGIHSQASDCLAREEGRAQYVHYCISFVVEYRSLVRDY